MKKIKKIKDIKICKLIKRIIKFLLKAIIFIALIYGLVYVPYNILKIETAKLEIEKTSFLVSEARDVRSCEVAAYQQLDLALKNAKKEKKEITQEEQNSFVNKAYAECLRVSGRDYILKNIKEENIPENKK